MSVLIVKTFAVVVMLLCATALTARKNHAFETKLEFWGLFIVGLVLLFVVPMFEMPINLLLAIIFAFVMGALIGPGIKQMMVSYVLRKRLEAAGYTKDRIKTTSPEELAAASQAILQDVENPAHQSILSEWNSILGLALYGTAAMTFITAVIVGVSNINFSFLGQGLLIALVGLIMMSLLNIFFFKSTFLRLLGSYVGALIFSLFLLYDFNQLELLVAAGDTSWESSVRVGVSIYLDIINLFMDLLDILSSR